MKSHHLISASRGFSLIETMVAMSVLSIVLLSIAGLTLAVATRSIEASALARRSAILATETGRLGALPFDSIESRVGCVEVSNPPLPHKRCISTTPVATNLLRVQVVVTPTNTAFRPDTVMFDRTDF